MNLTDIITAAVAQPTVELDVKRALERALEEHLPVNSAILGGIHPGVTRTGEACGRFG